MLLSFWVSFHIFVKRIKIDNTPYYMCERARGRPQSRRKIHLCSALFLYIILKISYAKGLGGDRKAPGDNQNNEFIKRSEHEINQQQITDRKTKLFWLIERPSLKIGVGVQKRQIRVVERQRNVSEDLT